MNILRWELQVQHFDWQMLSACIVNRNTAVLATGDQNFTVFRVAKLSDWFIELDKFVGDACLLDVKNTHSTGFETAREDWKGWMGSNAKRLVNRR